MMKNIIKYIAIILISVVTYSCDKFDIQSEQADAFVKLYGDWSSDIGVDVKCYKDGYLVLATTTSTSNMTTDITIFRTDEYGNQKGNMKTKDGGGNDLAGSLETTSDGGFVVVGTVEDTINNNENIFLAKYNSDLNLEWEKLIGGTYDEEGVVIKKAPAGYIITGSTNSPHGNNPAGVKDIYLVKVDDNGNIEWESQFGGEGTDYAADIIVYSEGYAIVGSTDYFQENNLGKFNIFLVKASFNGGEVDKFSYGSIYNDYGNALVETEDAFIVVGSLENNDGSDAEVYLIKIDKNNLQNTIWNESFGSNLYDQGFDILNTNSGFAVVGNTEISKGTTAVYLLEINEDGTEKYNNILGNYNQSVYSFETTSDGGYIMVGSSGEVGNEMIYLMKVNSEGDM